MNTPTNANPAVRQTSSGNNANVDAGAGGKQVPENTFSVGAFALSLIFTVLLITAPEQLDAAWQWIRDLPLVLEVVVWVALLPWLLAYLAWQASWALWLRVLVVSVLVGGVALSFWKSRAS